MNMNISYEYIQLFTEISQSIDFPQVEGIYLPHGVSEKTKITDIEKKDEFAVVVLEDGNAGPFYVSLDDTLTQLKSHLESINLANKKNTNTLNLIKKFNSNKLHERAIALGAINAVSQFIMHKANFTTPDKSSASIGINQAIAGERIGMIGYFSPLIARLLTKDIEILVLEKNPGRVPDTVKEQKGFSLTQDVADLSGCDHILCTASTLINNTLDEVLIHSKSAKSFSLIGPSGSSLPDILFKHGVDAVGGYHLNDIPRLKQALAKQESWGDAGNKYQLTPDNYPGIETLLSIIQNKQH